MCEHPTPILGLPGLGDRDHRLVVPVDDWLECTVRARTLQVNRTTQSRRRMAHVDRGLLAPARLLLPDVGDRDPNAAEYCSARLADLEARREHGIRAGDGNFALVRLGEPAERFAHTQNFRECSRHILSSR